MKTGRGWWALAGVGALTLLLALYVGAYYTLAEQSWTETGETFPLYIVNEPIRPTLGWMFEPIHQIDRRLRPELWKSGDRRWGLWRP